MKCECGQKMECVRRYKVTGKQDGHVPGFKRSYRCQTCQQVKKTLEIDPALLVDLQRQFHERRLSQNAEIARLKEQITYLKMPVKSGERRIRRIRQKLVELLDDTF